VIWKTQIVRRRVVAEMIAIAGSCEGKQEGRQFKCLSTEVPASGVVGAAIGGGCFAGQQT